MMTINEFEYYKEKAIKLFDFMDGKINTLNSGCVLEILTHDIIGNAYATIRFPNHIVLYIGNIVDAWKPEYNNIIPRNDFICTTMVWSIAHELYHADQLISTNRYNNNPEYKQLIEMDAENYAYRWVLYHSRELELIGEFEVCIEKLTSALIVDDIAKCDYKKANCQQFYFQTICNTVFRDYNAFMKLDAFSNEKNIDHIVLHFCDIDHVVIKEYGKYVEENVPLFCSLVYKWAAYYDNYNVDGSCIIRQKDDEVRADVNISISNPTVYGMAFKEGGN